VFRISEPGKIVGSSSSQSQQVRQSKLQCGVCDGSLCGVESIVGFGV
jgi:hypothetical protein